MTDHEKQWRRLARKVVQVVNAGWWLDRFNPLLVLFSLIAGVTILLLRNQRVETSTNIYLAAIGGALACLALVAWLFARRRFVRVDDGYVRIEKELGLHNALSTAREGAGPWPQLPPNGKAPTGYSWHWPRLILPLAFAAIVIAASLLIPVSQVTAGDSLPANEPLAWEEMESWLEKLDDETDVEKADLEQVREKIENLRDEPEEEWFSHSSMEATDTLKQQLRQSLQQLAKDSSAASRSLGALQKYSSQLSESARNQLTSEYEEALKGLQGGNLSPNSKLMEALKGADLNNLSQLSDAQIKELMDSLGECKSAAGQCLGGSEAPAGWKMDADLFSMGAGSPGARFPDGSPIQRGPGEAPISLSENPTDLATSNPEGVESKDYSRATFGDTLAVGEDEHEIDKSNTGPRSAGSIQSQGKGGDRIWRESLVPEEREVLKRYFK